MSEVMFDQALLYSRHLRAAKHIGSFDFLLRHAAAEIGFRLAGIQRNFPVAAVMGGFTAALADIVHSHDPAAFVVACEAAPCSLAADARPGVIANPGLLPFADGSLNLAASALTLHFVNDLPGALIQIRRALAPDGLFIGAVLGGETLRELREAFLAAELEFSGGASPRVMPMADVRDYGALLQRAGFALPVADSERLTVTYEDLFALMRDLRGMGAANALTARSRKPIRRAALMRAAEIYAERFPGEGGRIRAAFEIIYMTGWAPHESQQKPLAPGSAKARLADALGTVERSAQDEPPWPLGVPGRGKPD